MDVEAAVAHGAFAMARGVLSEILGQIGPTPADADHDSLARVTNKTDVESDWRSVARLVEVVKLDI